MSAKCQHPPTRLFTGWANNEHMKMCMWVGCCECGEVLTLDLLGDRRNRAKRNPAAKMNSDKSATESK